MRVLGITGCEPYKGARVIGDAIPALRRAGLRVSVLVEAPDDFDPDRPGKDSYEHRRAGAQEVVLSSTKRWALMHEGESRRRASLAALMAQLGEADLILVLGFEAELRATLAGEGIASRQPVLLSLPTDGDPQAIADRILAALGPLEAPAAQRV